MGRTLIHEHVIVGMPGWQFDLGAPKYVRADLIARAVDKLQELQARGCNTIVDPCPLDIGRDVEFCAEVAQRSGTNIIVATGFYTESEGQPAAIRYMPDEAIFDLFMHELTNGVGETGIKAGVVKIASGPDPSSEYESRIIGIATKAAQLTGVPIISHTHLATHGHHQLDLVLQNGGCANCTVIGHSGDRDDHDYQRSLAERDAFVGLDRFGTGFAATDDERTRNVVQMVESGHRDRILMSHDHVLCVLGRMGVDMAFRKPEYNITRIFDYVLPRLRAQGVSDADIEAILVDNPRTLFANAAARFAQTGGRATQAEAAQ
jgi:phosphotriesterase-related protein